MNILIPNKKLLNELDLILNNSIKEFLNISNRDSEDLIDILNSYSKKSSLHWRYEWDYASAKQTLASPYVCSSWTTRDKKILFFLHEESVANDFNSEKFYMYIKHVASHELVHVEQYKRTGYDVVFNTKSAYEKAVDQKLSPNKLMKSYLAEDDEIMARGHDLAEEICYAKQCGLDPREVFESCYDYIDDLHTLQTYNRFFKKTNKVIKQLLSYTNEYISYYL